jgi:hypothetical protein
LGWYLSFIQALNYIFSHCHYTSSNYYEFKNIEFLFALRSEFLFELNIIPACLLCYRWHRRHKLSVLFWRVQCALDWFLYLSEFSCFHYRVFTRCHLYHFFMF